ncbi:MAG: sigma factor-like helix-turn-helix DNA-binding protein [Butyricicoccus sp.]
MIIKYSIEPFPMKLCRLARQGDGPRGIFRRYTRLVKTCARPYFLGRRCRGSDAGGYARAAECVREYDEARAHPLERLQVVHHAEDFLGSAAAVAQARPAQSSMSIDRPLFEDLAESRTRVTAPNGDPESLVIGNEEREERKKKLYSLLSEFEAQVLTLFLDGLSYEEMSEALHKPIKSVDNAVQRIKRKSAAIKPI